MQRGDIIRDAEVQFGQAVLMGCVADLLENSHRDGLIGDETGNSASRQSFAVSILHGIQLQFRKLIALESAHRDDAAKSKIMRKALAIQRRREIVVRCLGRILPSSG